MNQNRYSVIKGEQYYHIKDNLTDKIYINCNARNEEDAIFLAEQMNKEKPQSNKITVDRSEYEQVMKHVRKLQSDFERICREMEDIIAS